MTVTTVGSLAPQPVRPPNFANVENQIEAAVNAELGRKKQAYIFSRKRMRTKQATLQKEPLQKRRREFSAENSTATIKPIGQPCARASSRTTRSIKTATSGARSQPTSSTTLPSPRPKRFAPNSITIPRPRLLSRPSNWNIDCSIPANGPRFLPSYPIKEFPPSYRMAPQAALLSPGLQTELPFVV